MKITFKFITYFFICLTVFTNNFFVDNVIAENKDDESKQVIMAKSDTSWEFGFGVGGLNVAHYIGANDSRKIAIPIPYVKYQGDFLKADRRGVRGVFWKSDRLEINMSFDLSLPVASSDNRARSGMPDLEFGIEFGPALDYIIYENKNKDQLLTFKWPLRAAFEIGKSNPEFYGWISSPSIQYRKQFATWTWRGLISIEFADQDYQSYFYDVDYAYVTDNREFYKSKGGIIDYSIGTSASKRTGQWFYGGFLNFVSLNNSVNVDSPLVKTDKNINFGAFIIWVF